MRKTALLCFLLLPLPSFAQGIALEKNDFQENLSTTSKVSGDIVMGVMLSDDAPSDLPPSVITGSLPDWGDEAGEPAPVCVRLVSKDGLYVAENTYIVDPGYRKERAPFLYKGKHTDFLASRSTVALVRPGRCENRSRSAIPALWKATGGTGSGTLHVYLNSAGNQTTVAVGRGHSYFALCTDVSEPTGIKYTTDCAIPVSKLPKDATARLTFFINRSNTEESFSIDVLPERPRD